MTTEIPFLLSRPKCPLLTPPDLSALPWDDEAPTEPIVSPLTPLAEVAFFGTDTAASDRTLLEDELAVLRAAARRKPPTWVALVVGAMFGALLSYFTASFSPRQAEGSSRPPMGDIAKRL